MLTLIVALVAALIAAGSGLSGARIVARSNLRSTLIGEQRAVITARRERLVALYAKVIALAGDWETIASFPPMRRGDDINQARTALSKMLVEKRHESGTLRALLLLEPDNEEMANTLDQLWEVFRDHMNRWAAMPNMALMTEGQSKGVEPVRALGRQLLAQGQGRIAVLDGQVDALLAPSPKSGWWPPRLT